MPLLYVDFIGRAPKEIQALLDAIHDAVVEAFGVRPRERYQVVRTQPASPEMKQRFYELVAANLAARCGLDPADLISQSPITAMRTGLSATAGHSSSPESSRECGQCHVNRRNP